MNGIPLSREEIIRIIALRKSGHSLPEIKVITSRGYGTIYRLIKYATVSPAHRKFINLKRGGSVKRSRNAWQEAKLLARSYIPEPMSFKHKLYLLAGLYWGEGSKKEFSLINSDPSLIKVFIECLINLGVPKNAIKCNIRVHDDIDSNSAVTFWMNLLSIERGQIGRTEMIKGKKTGKLKYGMCRVRVAKGAPYFKLVMSMIEKIRSDSTATVVQWIEQGTPKP